MSAMTNLVENSLIDFLLRGQSWSLPTDFYVGLLTAAPSDTGGGTEVSQTGYARAAVTRSLAAWAGTQSAGSTTASTGTTHKTSNNAVIDLGTPSTTGPDATHCGVWDASTSGNLLFYYELPVAKTLNTGSAITFASGALQFTLGITGGLSDYLANKLIDYIFRAQSFTPAATLYVGLTSGTSTNAGPGTEFSAGNYARVSYASSLANWSGTQAAASTSASSGTGGRSSNNVAITFVVPSANWGTALGDIIMDASSGGNMYFYATLVSSKTCNAGDDVAFAADKRAVVVA